MNAPPLKYTPNQSFLPHSGIRSLQCILLKVALLLGVKIYTGIEFQEIQEPDAQIGWHAKLNPSDHPLNLYEP